MGRQRPTLHECNDWALKLDDPFGMICLCKDTPHNLKLQMTFDYPTLGSSIFRTIKIGR